MPNSAFKRFIFLQLFAIDSSLGTRQNREPIDLGFFQSGHRATEKLKWKNFPKTIVH